MTFCGCGTLVLLTLLGVLGYPVVHEKHRKTIKRGYRRLLEQRQQRQQAPQQPPEHTFIKDDEQAAIQLGIDGPIHDVMIAGAGPGGLTAALFASRAGLDVLVLGSETGLLSETPQLDNFPSYTGRDGPTWLQTTKQQALQFGAKFVTPGILGTSLTREKQYGLYTLTTNAPKNSNEPKSYYAWSVIVASGATPRRLGLPKEDVMWGSTMHNCAICDGHLYRDKTVMVVGGGDSAIDAAIQLARYAKKVYLIHRRTELSGKNHAAIDVLRTTVNIKMLTPYEVTEWELDGQNQMIGAKIRHSESQAIEELAADGVFVMIGATPNTQWLSDIVDLEDGLVKLNGATQTSASGIFAVGEVSDSVYKQAITASAEGAKAAIDAERWLRETHGVRQHVPIPPPEPDVDVVVEKEPETSVERQVEAVEEEGIPCDLTQEDCMRKVVAEHHVVVFSKSYCPYCRKALEALAAAGITEPFIVDLTGYDNPQEIQTTLQSITGRRTVPNVFIGGNSIGGGDETSRLQAEGRLVELLVEAGALPPPENSQDEEQQGEHCNPAELSCVKELIQKYPVLMFTLSWCPECKRTLELLASILGPTRLPHLIDLEDYDKDVQLQMRQNMVSISGRRGVPNLFIQGEFFGGYAQTVQMHEAGQLEAKLKDVGWLVGNEHEQE